LAHALLYHGAEVRILDDLSTGHRSNIPEKATFIEGSILDKDAVTRAVEGCSVIFHEAAMVSVPESVAEPRRCFDVNVLGTKLVIDAARDAGTSRIVFASSAALYGADPQIPSTEQITGNLVSPYARSKSAGERLMQAATEFPAPYRISTVSLRYFNIFGPRQDPKSAYAAAIAAFADALTHGRAPTIYGDGGQTRDFTPVANVVHANLLAATTETNLRGEAVNIGTGRQISLLDVINEMQKVLGTNLTPVFEPVRAGDVRHSCPDITRARELLGYKPIMSFAQGIKQLLA
ncbi:MAG: NAD-dependent epimerase/dehydratase family protein, partial [Phycisphaerales bacterium]|nr:NAD-dependent epimerase/dehydratase family protein [Phycisphaerales bacterium]